MKPLLIIKTGCTVETVPAAAGDFEDWIRQGVDWPVADTQTVEVFKGAPLPDPAGLAGAVVTGSPAMVTERLPWSENTAAWLRQALDETLPVLGICYGHQLLAHALGGTVGDNPLGREFGTVAIEQLPDASTDPLFGSLPQSFQAQVTHMQSVLIPPAGSSVLASNAHDACQALRFTPSAWGVQFHPEFSAEVMGWYLQAREGVLLEEGWDTAALRASIRETPAMLPLLQNFRALLRT